MALLKGKDKGCDVSCLGKRNQPSVSYSDSPWNELKLCSYVNFSAVHSGYCYLKGEPDWLFPFSPASAEGLSFQPVLRRCWSNVLRGKKRFFPHQGSLSMSLVNSCSMLLISMTLKFLVIISEILRHNNYEGADNWILTRTYLTGQEVGPCLN